jgi:hypothetical protein
MTANPLESAWGFFYHELHVEAQRIRKMMRADASQLVEGTDAPASETTESVRSIRPADFTTNGRAAKVRQDD